MWSQMLVALAGIWLMAAPQVLGYTGLAAKHSQTLGPIIASAACCALWEVLRPLRWLNVTLGAWLLLAPWLLGFPTRATINDMIVGAAVAGVSLIRGQLKHRYGGGWSELWRKTA